MSLKNQTDCIAMKYFLSIVFISICIVGSTQAQSLEEAKKLYLEKKYEEAMSAFEKAVRSSPKNASYNQWYGTCLLETGNPEEAEKYLKFAATKNIPEAYNSLGKLYFDSYRFEQSAKAYEEYYTFLTEKKREQDAQQIKLLLDRSKRAARMVSRCEDIQIIDSVIVNKKDFLNHYILSEESGTLQNSINGTDRIIYENQLKDKRYYARPDRNKQYKLYSQSKLQDKWTDEKMLNLPSDSTGSDNFPFVLSDGVTVYYASTGNESIGGYDLFVTRYNMNNDSFLAPEQLGMPFNSTANDYMMAIDEYNGVGYFATDRFQPEDTVIIYTFIPNEEIKVVKSDSLDLLTDRSKITSIRDTWVPGVNYASLLQKVKNSILQTEKKKERDFVFVINDNIVYYTLDEFESDAAKQLFVQSQSVFNELTGLEKQLDEQRKEYARGDKNKKQSLTASILANENRLPGLHDQYQELAVKARNTEIMYLKQQ